MDFFLAHNTWCPGGNALNQAVAFSRLGFQSSFVGALGNDAAGDRIFRLFSETSVDTTHTHRIDGDTANNQIINDENGERFGVEGAWQGGVYDGFVLSESDWNYLADFDIWASHVDCLSLEKALKRKTNKQFLTVDFLHLRDYRLLFEYPGVIDIAYFGGEADMAEDLSRIAGETGALVVLTLGKAGSMAFHNGRVYKQAALKLNKVIDTTGCGDAFQAAFTAEYFTSKDIAAALYNGAESGRLTAARVGGT